MADDADRAASLQAAEIDAAIAAHAARPMRPAFACIDCTETLAPYRRAMGARRCVECQETYEQEARRRGRR